MLATELQSAVTNRRAGLDGSARLLSLDVLRGLTVAGMILVTDPGTYAAVYPQLRHALWNDPTAADLIFPCFLMMVGASVALSFSARIERGETRTHLAGHALRRGLWLIALGLVLNAFPHFDLGHLQTLRLPGILQRIAVCYWLICLCYLPLCRRSVSRPMRVAALAGVCLAVLVAYWLLLTFYPTPGFAPGRLDPLGTLPAVVDRAVFTVPHMFQWGIKTPGFGITFDPEGILSTLGALGTTLLGLIAGEVLRSSATRVRQCAILAAGGTSLWLLSLGLRPWMPLNKQIYTPSFALWSAGLSILALAGLLYLIDLRGMRRGWTLPLIFGTNAILAFALSQVLTGLLGLWRWHTAGDNVPLYMALNARLFAPWLPARIASLSYAVCVVLLNAAILYPLYRRKVFLRL